MQHWHGIAAPADGLATGEWKLAAHSQSVNQGMSHTRTIGPFEPVLCLYENVCRMHDSKGALYILTVPFHGWWYPEVQWSIHKGTIVVKP